MKAPAGSYLILARPRSRTAWLTALMFGDIPCYHDELHRIEDWVAAGDPFGLVAPSAPMIPIDYVVQTYAEAPVVVIERPAQECYESLSRFTGIEFPPSNVSHFEKRFQALVDRLPIARRLTIPFIALDQYETACRIHQHCVGRPLDPERHRAFNLLRIEQHLPKVIENTPTAMFRRS